jgi:hypothetical protein
LTSPLEKAMIGSKVVMKSLQQTNENTKNQNVFKAMIYTGNSIFVKSILWLTYFLGITSHIFMWSGDIIIPKLQEIEKQKNKIQKEEIIMENTKKKILENEKREKEQLEKRKNDELLKIKNRNSIIMLITKISTIISAKMIKMHECKEHINVISNVADINFNIDFTDIKTHENSCDQFELNMDNIFKQLDTNFPIFQQKINNNQLNTDQLNNDQLDNIDHYENSFYKNFISSVLFVPNKLAEIIV